MPISTGITLKDRYKVVQELGRGGMADVYKVWDDRRSTYLALKLLREDISQDQVFLRRFRREARTLAKLQHPNIVRFYGLEQEDVLTFMLMDLVEGESLRTEIFRLKGQPMSQERIRQVMQAICSALTFAHSEGIVHSDIKPGNILVDRSGPILVTDFGIAQMTDAATATMIGIGTPAYMAPEQIRGQDPIPQTDIYALGIVLYQMATGGERPFTGERAKTTGPISEKVRWEQLNLAPPRVNEFNSNISSELEAVILKCLQKDPAERYQTAMELLNALDAALFDHTLVDESWLAADDGRAASRHEQADLSGDANMQEDAVPVQKKLGILQNRLIVWLGGAAVLIVGGLAIYGLRSEASISPDDTGAVAASKTNRTAAASGELYTPDTIGSATPTPAVPTATAQAVLPQTGSTQTPKEEVESVRSEALSPVNIGDIELHSRFAINIGYPWAVDLDFTFLAGYRNKQIDIYKTADLTLVREIPANVDPWQIKFSPSNKYIAAHRGDSIWVWDISSGELIDLYDHRDTVQDFALSPAGDEMAVSIHGSVLVWDLYGTARTIDYSRLGEYLAFNELNYLEDGTLTARTCYLPDAAGPAYTVGFRAGDYKLTQVTNLYVPFGDSCFGGYSLFSISPQGYAAETDENGKIRIFPGLGAAPSQVIETDDDAITQLAISVSGEMLGVVSGNTLKIWSVEDGTILWTHSGVNSVAWSANGDWLMIWERDGTFTFWHVPEYG